MAGSKADIITQLQKDILSLQGFKTILSNTAVDMGLGCLKNAFPCNTFPLGVMHEFICNAPGDTAPTCGFIAGLLTALMRNGGVSLWIGSSLNIFPPALKSFGINPGNVIFIDLQKEKEILWAIEEALKCDGLAAVVGEIPGLSFTVSRRLQLAVEQSRVTGFIIRQNPGTLNNTACVTRWKITSLHTDSTANMPGVGFPRWNVELLKVRNGNPGTWQIEFIAGRFRPIYNLTTITEGLQKKTG